MADTRIVSGGVAVSSSVLVSADQVTVLGDGATGNPLRLGIFPGQVIADYVPAGGPPAAPGVPVVVSAEPPSFGVASVSPGSADVGESADVVGVVSSIMAGGIALRTAGAVTLSADDWDSVTGDIGGLVPETSYYLSTQAGRLTATPPSDPGTFLSRVGVALSATTLLLTTPSDPIIN